MKANFLDLGIGWGQTKTGLERSGELAWAKLSKTYQLKHYFKLKGKCRSGSFSFFNTEDIDLPLSLYQSSYFAALGGLKTNNLNLFWGGDHSISLSTVQAFIDTYPNGKVIWIDAHADLNIPETSPSGNFHGMPMSYLLGLKNSPLRSKGSQTLSNDQIRYLGLRSLDPFENYYLENSNLISYPKQQIQNRGLSDILLEILNWVGNSPVHISFDIDVVDPQLAPSTGVPVFGGFSENELVLTGKMISKLSDIKSIDIVEINPEIGDEESVRSTYQLAYRFLDPFLNSTRRFYDSDISNIKGKFPNASQRHFSFPAPDPF